jgi:tetratricopeptide (TPR) repeat protein
MVDEFEQASDPLLQLAADVRTVADLAGLLRRLRRRQARRRRDSELTYRELAEKAGWSQAAVGEYFVGRTLPPVDRFDVLVVLLGATPAEQGALATARDRVEESHPRRQRGPAGPGSTVPRQLPADVVGFTGRDAHLASLDALLATAGQTRAVVIAAVSGTAGIGKTALAVHWAHRVADQFPDGQLYVDLRGFDPSGQTVSPTEAVRAFLDALGVPPQRVPAGLAAQAGLYRTLLVDKRMLVVLDNARDADQARQLLPGTPGALAVVTSRNQLTGLLAADGGHPLTLDLLTEPEAWVLLAHRLGPDRVAAEPRAVEEIIASCVRLPLALTIAAARAATRPSFPLTVLAAELREAGGRLDALSAGEPVTEVRAVFSWSYTALTPAARRLFRLLGLPAGPDISTAAAASLAGLPLPQVRPLLAELVRASLMVEHAPGRYACHDLLRAYATDLAKAIDRDDQSQVALGRLLDHYVHTGYAADRLLIPHRDPLDLLPAAAGTTPEQLADHQQAMAWFTAERTVLLAAARQAADTGFDTHAWQLCRILDTFLDRQGHWLDLAALWRATLDVTQRLPDPTPRAHAHRLLANAYTHLRQIDDAHVHLRHALDLSRRAGDVIGQAHTHHHIADTYGRQARHTEALDHAVQALALYRAADYRRGQAGALNSVGWYHTKLGDHQQALDDCGQALTLHRQLGDREGEASAWDSLGHAHHHLGHHREAAECYQHAIDLFRELGTRYYEAASLTGLGDTEHAAADPAAARNAWTASLTILTDLDHPGADAVHAKLRDLDHPPTQRGPRT